MNKLALLLVLCLSALNATASEAAGADVTGAACTPDFDSHSVFDVTGTGGTGVMFRALFSGGLNFNCAIPNAPQMTSPTTLSILYTDDTGTIGNEVIASYYKVNKTTGVLTRIAEVLTHTGCTTGSFKTCSASFSDTFDPATYGYFIAVTLERATDTPTEIFWGATVQ